MAMLGVILMLAIALVGSVLMSKFVPYKLEKLRFKLGLLLQTKFFKYFNYAFWVWLIGSWLIPAFNNPVLAVPMLLLGFLPVVHIIAGKARDIRRKIPVLK